VTVAAPASLTLPEAVKRVRFEIGDRPRPVDDFLALLALRGAVRRHRADVVHAHGAKAAVLSLTALQGQAVPVLVTFHNLWRGGSLTPILRHLLPRARAAVAVSAAVRKSLLLHRVPADAAQVIPNGVDLAAFAPVPRPADRPFTAAFIGRLTEEKGVHVLLEAVHRLTKPDDPAILIAGEGPLRRVVEDVIDGLPETARSRDLGPQADIRPVYDAVDVVVVPSLSEGFGLTAVEAMACGLPVIASRVGGLAEVVTPETGILVPAGDAEALVDALRELAADRDGARRMGEAGRKRAEAEFGQDRMLDHLADSYRAALS
jgi:glycosyltransferase involved in cell wall biosynthesis